MNNLAQQAREHKTNRRFGIDAGSTIIEAIAVSDFNPAARKDREHDQRVPVHDHRE
jgi:activator of 2-hydroxyglutaryl-CoA dehydratase